MPALEKTLTEASPLVDALHTFFPELNPILSYFNFHQTTIAAFMTNGGADLAADYGTGQRGQTQIGIIRGPLVHAVQVRRRTRRTGCAATPTCTRTRSCAR